MLDGVDAGSLSMGALLVHPAEREALCAMRIAWPQGPVGIDKATLLRAVAVIESGRLDHLLAPAGAHVAPQHDVYMRQLASSAADSSPEDEESAAAGVAAA